MEENLKEKEYYREKIVEIIEKIDRLDMLEYLFFFIKEKFKVG